MTEVTRVDGPAGVERDAWNALASRSSTATIFQTWEWHRAWWDAYADRHEDATRGLRAADGVWHGLLPLAVDPGGVLRLAGDGMADYMDALAAPDAAAQLWNHAVAEAPHWSRAALGFLPDRSSLLPALEGSGLPLWTAPPIACPRADLADADVAIALSNKKSLRRHHNHFRKRAGYRVDHLDDATSIEPLLDPFFEQHIARWSGTPTPSLFLDPRPRAFYRALVRAMDRTGWLRFTRLSVGGRPIAFHFGFVHRGTFVWYKPTFDPELSRRSPGEALLKELLDRAIAEGLRTFDFTVGGEAFKTRFATSTPLNRNVTVYRSRAPWLARRMAEGLKSGLKQTGVGRGAVRTLKRLSGRHGLVVRSSPRGGRE